MLFKRKNVVEELTFKERVGRFWLWFEENADRFHRTIGDGRCGDLTEEVSAKVGEWFPGFGWVFGAGEAKGSHAFTLTGEGDAHRRLLAKEWWGRAPQIEGWSFYPSRQRSDEVGSHSISIGERDYRPIEFWVTPEIDEEHERVNIVAWNPVFESMDERDRYQVLFLWLDEVLGEVGTADWIGSIELHANSLAGAFPVTELAEYVDRAVLEKGWESREPGDVYHLYRLPEALGGFPRADTIAGSCSQMSLVQDYLQARGKMSDPLPNLGAAYAFVSFSVDMLSDGKEVDERGELEELLDTALRSHDAGRCLGGAIGKKNAYIDLIIYDRNRSWKLILDVLRERGFPKGTAVHPFADDSSRVLAEL